MKQRNAAIVRGGVAVAFLAALPSFAQAQVSAAEREEVRAAAVKSCVATMPASMTSRKQAWEKYCMCSAVRMSQNVSREMAEAFARTGKLDDEALKIARGAAEACKKELL